MKKNKLVDLLTKKRLKEVLNYNSDSGLFTWVKNERATKIGGEVGCIGKKGYRQICIDGISHRANRLAFLYKNGKIPNEIDHINRVKDDNSWENLREITHSDNNKNRGRLRNNTSGITGVYICRKRNKWKSFIKINKKLFHLGQFVNKHDAIIARYNAEVEND